MVSVSVALPGDSTGNVFAHRNECLQPWNLDLPRAEGSLEGFISASLSVSLYSFSFFKQKL